MEIHSPSNLTQIKAGILEKLSSRSNAEELRVLLRQSAIANESRVLEESDLVHPGMKLAILPPVCGG